MNLDDCTQYKVMDEMDQLKKFCANVLVLILIFCAGVVGVSLTVKLVQVLFY